MNEFVGRMGGHNSKANNNNNGQKANKGGNVDGNFNKVK